MSKLPMTAAGHGILEDELNQCFRVERPRLVQRIQDAIADDSNLAENSEYQAAKVEQDEARIAALEDMLARAEVIDVSKLSGNMIKFGAKVTLIEQGSGEKKVWQIVGEPEARACADRQDQGCYRGGGDSRRYKVYQVRQVDWLEESP